MDNRAPLLALLREDESLDRLPADPRRFMAAPMSRAQLALTIVGNAAITGLVVFLYVTRMLFKEHVAVQIGVGVFVGVVLALGWIAVIDGVRGRRKRGAFFRRYERMRGGSPRPRFGTIVRSETTQSDSGTLERVTAEIALDGGGMLHARRHPRRSLAAADGSDIRRNSHHAPQHGDAATIFDDPTGVLPPLVLTNRRPR